MSYVPLGDLCGSKNGAPFANKPQTVKTVLLSNFGGASYASTTNHQCGPTTFANAYATQLNPYASSYTSSMHNQQRKQ